VDHPSSEQLPHRYGAELRMLARQLHVLRVQIPTAQRRNVARAKVVELRQQVLERRGWTIYRVWSTDWFKDRRGQIERLVTLVQGCRERAAANPPPATPPVVQPEVSSKASLNPTEPMAAAPNATVYPTASAASASTASLSRALARPYVFAPGEGRFASEDLLYAPSAKVSTAISTVVQFESPIHATDLMTRVVSMWDTKAGSRIADLVNREIARAVRESDAEKVYVCNLMTKHGETDGYKASDFVHEIHRYLGGRVDRVIVNTGPFSPDVLKTYAQEGSEPVVVDRSRLIQMVPSVSIEHLNLADDRLARHDPERLVRAIFHTYDV